MRRSRKVKIIAMHDDYFVGQNNNGKRLPMDYEMPWKEWKQDKTARRVHKLRDRYLGRLGISELAA